MKQNNLRILSIDPSGTGTTGVFFKAGAKEKFYQFTDKEWTEHYQFVYGLVEKKKPDILIFEELNWISLRGKDMTALLRLMGALEVSLVEQVEKVPVNQVKKLGKQLVSRERMVEGIEYQVGRGKGWSFKGAKISTHELDAYLVYWLWKNKQNNKLIGKSIAGSKIKAKTKPKVIEEELFEDIDDLLEERECIEISDDWPEEPEDIIECPGDIEEPELPEEPEDIDENPDDRDIDEEIEND